MGRATTTQVLTGGHGPSVISLTTHAAAHLANESTLWIPPSSKPLPAAPKQMTGGVYAGCAIAKGHITLALTRGTAIGLSLAVLYTAKPIYQETYEEYK